MKTITCTNSRNYRLTEGNDYTVVRETDNFYYIANDRDTVARYSKTLFTEVVEEEEESEPELALEEKRQLILNGLSVTNNHILIQDTTLDIRISVDNPLGNNATNISCGVRQLFNLNDLATAIQSPDFIGHFDSNIVTNEFKIELYKRIIEKRSEILSSNVVLLSTNITDNGYFSLIDGALSQLCDTSTVAYNNNSGNDIKLWVINKAPRS